MDVDYRRLYTYLFNQITDAIYDLDSGQVDTARRRLIMAQRQAEEMYIEPDDHTDTD